MAAAPPVLLDPFWSETARQAGRALAQLIRMATGRMPERYEVIHAAASGYVFAMFVSQALTRSDSQQLRKVLGRLEMFEGSMHAPPEKFRAAVALVLDRLPAWDWQWMTDGAPAAPAAEAR